MKENSVKFKTVPQPAAQQAPEPTPAPVMIPQALPAPVPEVMPTRREDPQWVSDLIGEDFKTWGPGLVAIESSTGTGKTSFILNNILPWCIATVYQSGLPKPKRILHLTNRTPLRDSVTKKISHKREENIRDEGLCGNKAPELECTMSTYDMIDCKNYQNLEQRMTYNIDYLKANLTDYSFVVCDEPHWFVHDAPFNKYTGALYDLLMELSKTATVIFATATPGEMFESWKMQGKIKPERYYRLNKKLEAVTQAYVYSEDQLWSILDSIAEGQKAWVFVKDYKRLVEIKERYGDRAGCYCSPNNEKGQIDALENCIKDGVLQREIVASTEVLYNGIDGKDRTLKHIIVEEYMPSKIIQEIGRKRPLDGEDTYAVYFLEPRKKYLNGRLYYIKHIYEVVCACWKLTIGKPQEWEELLKKEDANDWITKCIEKELIEYDYVTCEYSVNRMCVQYLKEEHGLLEKLKNQGYVQTMQEEVWDKVLAVQPQKYVQGTVIDCIKSNMGKTMCKTDMQTMLVEVGLCDDAQSIKKLNVLLKPLNIEIVSKTDWTRNSPNYGKVMYWLQAQS